MTQTDWRAPLQLACPPQDECTLPGQHSIVTPLSPPVEEFSSHISLSPTTVGATDEAKCAVSQHVSVCVGIEVV